MEKDLDAAKRYRRNADELRSVARAIRGGAIKRELLANAADYERWAEARERANGLCRKARETKASQ